MAMTILIVGGVNDMRKKILQIIKQIKEGDIDDTGMDYRLYEDFGMDSIEIMELVVAIEDEFDIEFDLDELDIEYLATIETLEQAVKGILHNKSNIVK